MNLTEKNQSEKMLTDELTTANQSIKQPTSVNEDTSNTEAVEIPIENSEEEITNINESKKQAKLDTEEDSKELVKDPDVQVSEPTIDKPETVNTDKEQIETVEATELSTKEIEIQSVETEKVEDSKEVVEETEVKVDEPTIDKPETASPVKEEIETVEAAEQSDKETEVQSEKLAAKKSKEKTSETKEEENVALVSYEEIKDFDFPQLIEKSESILECVDFPKIKDAFAVILIRQKELEQDYEQKLLLEKNNKTEVEKEETQEKEIEVDPLAELKQQFNNIKSKYSKLRKEHQQKIETEKLRNFELKNELLNDLRLLIESEETLKQTWEDFKNIQQKWKEIGHVPHTQNQELWNNFNFLVDKFLDKIKLNRELRDLDSKKNLESKIEICEKIEELLISDSIEDSYKKLREYQIRWREIGPVPSAKRDELNTRFIQALDRINLKRREGYDSFRLQLEKNLELKQAFIVKIKEINEQEPQTVNEWTQKTKEVEELMKMWRSVGTVPKKDNNVVWEIFKEEVNLFFDIKKKFFEKLKQEQLENYNKKLLLCKQAEALQDSTDWRKTTEELISLQNEWKSIGPVPRRYSDSLWKKFRAACDVYFNKKQAYFANAAESEHNNLKLKEELIEKMSQFEFSEDNQENLAAIKDFQRKFFALGRVPIKQKDKIQAKFQENVEKLLGKLNISKKEKRDYDLKNKYESMASGRGGEETIRKESFHISNKISKLESDINLWENNIEFFAKSKNADILTKEFREKIENAKAEVVIQKEKLKMLRSM